MVCDDLFLMLSYIKPEHYVSPEYSQGILQQSSRVHAPAGFHSPARVGVWSGVGLSSNRPARQAALPSISAAVSPAMLPPYPESLFRDVISAVALAEVEPLPTVM